MTRESRYYPDGAEFDPNAPWNEPAPPSAVCDNCHAVFEADCLESATEESFYQDWLESLDASDRLEVSAQMPDECPECHPEDFALEADPDNRRKVERGG